VTSGSRRPDDEVGATLILAFIFLVVIGLIVTALVTWAGNDLVNTKNFTSAKSVQYSTGGAVQLEMQSLRYTYSATTSLAACNPNGGATVQLSSTTPVVVVYCQKTLSPFSTATRVVNFYACPYKAGITASSCQSSPFLQAAVTFNDYDTGGANHCSSTTTVTCGAGMTITSWKTD